MEDLTMKKIFRLFPAALAVIVFASCADKMGSDINVSESDVPVQEGNLVQMTFSASMGEDVDSKTSLVSSTGDVLWEATDAITVFSVGEESVTRTSFGEPELFENGVVARFSGLADASAETYYAVYPHSDANKYVDGTFSVTFPAEQIAVANGFASGSNVSVAVSVKDAEGTEQILQFKNVGALLAFSFNAAEDAARTKSVTFKARKSADDAETPEFWGLTGDVTVTIDENGLPIASAGNVDHVTLNAPEGGFELGKNYFIPVCPVGDCAGIQVVFTDQDDQTFVKNNDFDFQLLRSDVFNAGKVILPYDDLPRDFEITINFAAASWPLEGDGPVTDQETWSGAPYKGQGETYTYYHTYTSVIDDEEKKLPLEVIIARERGSSGDDGLYTWVANKGLSNTGQYGVILFPGIQNRYLKEVGLIGTSTSSSAFGLFEFGKGFPGNSYGAGANKEAIYRLYEDKIVAGNGTTLGAGAVSLSQPVGVRLRRANTIKSVRLVYSATSPGNAPTE